jgi:hypothetical protein
MAKTKLVEKVADVDAGRVTFKFEDGEEAVFEVSRVDDAISSRLMLHGASQKIGDSYAGAGDDEIADPLAYAKERVRDTIAQLYAGDWRTASTGTGGILAEAMSAVSGKSREECAEALAGMSDDEKKDLRKKKKIAAALGRIKLQRDAARVARLEKLAAEEVEADEEEATA